MRRLQLGSSLGSSMDTTPHRTENQAPMPVKSQSIDVSSINHKDCKWMCACCILSNNNHDVVLSISWKVCYFGLDASHQVPNTGVTEKRCKRPSTVTTIITGSKWSAFPESHLKVTVLSQFLSHLSPPSRTLFNPCCASHQSVAHCSAWQ